MNNDISGWKKKGIKKDRMNFNNHPNYEPRRRLFKAIFIDGSFLFHCMVGISVRINYRKLIQLFLNTGDFLIYANYYTALPNEYDMEEKHRNFIKILKKDVKVRVRSVPLLKAYDAPTSSNGGSQDDTQQHHVRYSKGEDILLASEMVRDAALGRFDCCVLLSGDADFCPVVSMVQDLGKPVIVAAFHGSLSHQLEMDASEVIYLDEHLDKIKL